MAEVVSSFNHSIDRVNKKGTMVFEGYLENDYAAQFMRGYDAIKASCKGGTLCIDTAKMLPFPQESLESAAGIYEDYTNNFSQINVIMPQNAVAKGQMKRMWKDKNITDKFNIVSQF